ncbi:MAG: hypothetical protein E6I38_11930 [Chloroflexi bacterium]|nr:MAG: hypothetical protein E6I38_11930 [Chloroflexota bacterium]
MRVINGAVDQINNLFATNRRSLPLEQVLSDLDFAREMVRQAVANCPEDRLDLRLLQELGPHGAGHDIAHADVITAWRQRAGI